MTFGERITYLRKQLKISQEELAKQVGTSGTIIGRYERDEMKPSIDVAKKIADVLGVTLTTSSADPIPWCWIKNSSSAWRT